MPGFFGEKSPNCIHLWVKFSIQNVVLRISRRKNSKMFPCCFPFLCFWRNVYWSALVPCNLLCPEIFLVARLHSGIILFAKCSISYVWQCFEYVCLDNCPVICTLTLCYVLHQIHSESWHIPNSAYSGTCKHIQAYSSLLRHISHPVQTSHIHNLAIFRTRGIFKTLWNFDQAYSEPYPSKKSSFRHYSAIFRTLCNVCLCRNLPYLECWNI